MDSNTSISEQVVRNLYNRNRMHAAVRSGVERYVMSRLDIEPEQYAARRGGFGRTLLNMALAGLALSMNGGPAQVGGAASGGATNTLSENPQNAGWQGDQHPRYTGGQAQGKGGQFAPKPVKADDKKPATSMDLPPGAKTPRPKQDGPANDPKTTQFLKSMWSKQPEQKSEQKPTGFNHETSSVKDYVDDYIGGKAKFDDSDIGRQYQQFQVNNGPEIEAELNRRMNDKGHPVAGDAAATPPAHSPGEPPAPSNHIDRLWSQHEEGTQHNENGERSLLLAWANEAKKVGYLKDRNDFQNFIGHFQTAREKSQVMGKAAFTEMIKELGGRNASGNERSGAAAGIPAPPGPLNAAGNPQQGGNAAAAGNVANGGQGAQAAQAAVGSGDAGAGRVDAGLNLGPQNISDTANAAPQAKHREFQGKLSKSDAMKAWAAKQKAQQADQFQDSLTPPPSPQSSQRRPIFGDSKVGGLKPVSPGQQAGNEDIFKNPAHEKRMAEAPKDVPQGDLETPEIDFNPAKLEKELQRDQTKAERREAALLTPIPEATAASDDDVRKARKAALEKVRRAEKVLDGTDLEKIHNAATVGEIPPDEFREFVEQRHKEEHKQWADEQRVKRDIRRAIGLHSKARKDGSSGYVEDAAAVKGDIVAAITGNVDRSDLHAYLGPDESRWEQNAFEFAKSEDTERPGPHDPQWLDNLVDEYREGMDNQALLQPIDAPTEPIVNEFDETVPFSRKNIGILVERFANEFRMKSPALRTHIVDKHRSSVVDLPKRRK
jgi:hypothetical protein